VSNLWGDPLEDQPPAEEQAAGCPLECADGWVQVKEKYAEHMADQKAERGTRAWESLYGAHLNSSYPCRIHRPVQFFRWAGGHYARDHDVGSCPECIESYGGVRKARKVAAMVAGDARTDQVRRDLDGS